MVALEQIINESRKVQFVLLTQKLGRAAVITLSFIAHKDSERHTQHYGGKNINNQQASMLKSLSVNPGDLLGW